jgi:hypothetical protein
MNALSIVYEEECSLIKYCSLIPNSYWRMGLICNKNLPVKGGEQNATVRRESQNLVKEVWSSIAPSGLIPIKNSY